ncbi:AAA family ATPase [Heliophilum fasciatum]|uniref:ATPase family protein associated with various cellular activities (AAA) n=1 Tax=Heliophilum fasciatum TaxID=35700 RepID=A0A4R2RHC2_9FIRM|nr:ATP-binding protein [Heliophilum fasciatum]MCW2279064.1 SpoVK/Ycf46/Vps4 family AAA+-type ATPase [Heliophilum fasciatum]TCP61527.1 ATPase family protein associated with various cellular activities (AAA) [Heliophilum fasciatum]
MKFRTEIIKIIEGGLERNKDKVKNYAMLLGQKLRDEGDEKFAERIVQIINNKSVHPVYMDEFMSKPLDQDSKLDMVDVLTSSEIKQDKIILSENTWKKIDNFILSIEHKSEFIDLGVSLPDTLLLYGHPGCGKTSIAEYVASRVELPLVTAKLDGLVSSLLGSTAKNIRKIFDYAKERPCILFLDEFDAIAKARNDVHEVGELKRVVNSLIQNIDDFSKNNILIAATNHETLLDPAVWRRFSFVVEVPKPCDKEIIKLIKLFLGPFNYEFLNEARKSQILIGLLNGLSPSIIKNICYNAVKAMVINKESMVSFARIVSEIYYYIGIKDIPLPKFLSNNGVSQQEISKVMGISLRQVRNHLCEGALKNERQTTSD